MAIVQVKILKQSEAPTETETAFRFGGRPLVEQNGTREWPVCASCAGAMQFLGQVPVDSSLVSLFMCQNEPGMCDDWDPDGGGNVAWLVNASGELELLEPPDTGVTLLGTTWGGTVCEVTVDSDKIDEYDTLFGAASEELNYEGVLGSLGGEPAWIEGEETPGCDECEKPLSFVANINQGPDNDVINFGDGAAFVFRCSCSRAKFLWQR